MALLIPPLVPFIRMLLLIAGLVSSLYASFALFLGFWRPIEPNGTDAQPEGPGEDNLYNYDDKQY